MPERAPAHGVVVLAAGASRRLGQPKQLLLHRGETLVHRAARLALETAPSDAVIVFGFDADEISSRIADLSIRRIDCADWQLGLGASLRAGVDALSQACAGVLVVLCDQPGLEASHLLSLRDAWLREPIRGVASHYAGRFGVSVLMLREWFQALDAHSDRGMRDLLGQRAEQMDLIANPALAFDVDRLEDLHHLS